MASHRLRDALSAPGCPLCRLVRESEEAWIWTLLYELSGDPPMHSELARSLGLCGHHADLMRRVVEARHLVSPGSVARLYETVVRDLLGRLERPRHLSIRREECPLCVYAARVAEREAYFIARLLRSPKWRELYSRSDGLCLKHLELVLSQADKDTSDWLIADTKERLAGLLGRLQELQRKQRYDVAEELLPEEASSWREALWRLGGMRYEGLLTREP